MSENKQNALKLIRIAVEMLRSEYKTNTGKFEEYEIDTETQDSQGYPIETIKVLVKNPKW